jgi:hypothetical protein
MSEDEKTQRSVPTAYKACRGPHRRRNGGSRDARKCAGSQTRWICRERCHNTTCSRIFVALFCQV